MRVVLLCGGSGKRLWPLSNGVRSKSFLKLLPAEHGMESMVQRVWRQLRSAGLTESTYIATASNQIDMLLNQIGNNVRLIVEPERRDTFPAIILAASYLHSMCKTNEDEVICFLPVDLYVEDHFFDQLLRMELYLKSSKADLALVGVRPTHPSRLYGYIVPEIAGNEEKFSVNRDPNRDGRTEYLRVRCFTEKPNQAEAEALIAQHALWNCGIFACKLSFLLEEMKNRGVFLPYTELKKQYGNMTKTSFDYEVVERVNSAIVVPYEGLWKDLGSWQTLTEELSHNTIGEAKLSESEQSHVINELHIPIAVVGLSNVVVAGSPDGILVADKRRSDKIKELLNHENARPMFEERRWGWYRVLGLTELSSGVKVLTKHLWMAAGRNISYQRHSRRSEYWVIVEGRGVFVLDGSFREVKAGDVLHIPVGSKHAIKAIADLEIIEVQTGSELIEEDIIRESLNWEDIQAK